MLTGIWHGAAWNFVFWGLYFGCIIALEKFLLADVLKKLWKPVQHLYALFFIIVGWVIFRSATLAAAFDFIKVMLGFSGKYAPDQMLMYFLHDYIIILLVAIVAALPIKEYFIKKVSVIRSVRLKAFILYGLRNAYALILFVVSFFYIIGSTFNPFIYFRF
jgi:alginate O-acetyltransferase complex protein AlgI